MKHQKKYYSKYQCDNKLSIYSNALNNSQYKKRIANVKSKYMQDFNNQPKMSKYCEEKNFNNLLTNYYQDYNMLKSKYNLNETEESDKNEYDINEEEFLIKRQNIDKIFSGDLFNIQDINFDLTDNLINELPREKNNNISLIKNTQIKEDYDMRLQESLNNKKYIVPNEDEENENEGENEYENNVNLQAENNNEIILEDNNNENNNNISSENNEINISEHNNKNNDDIKIFESMQYLENDAQFNLENNDNYLILNQPNLNKDDLPLFQDIISSNYNKNYRVPFYEHPDIVPVNEDRVKKVEERYSDFEDDKKNQKENIDNNHADFNNNINDIHNNEKNDDENVLILENKNNENIKLEDILNSNFQGEYLIPEYKIPNKIKLELEEEKKEEKNKKLIYSENIMKVDNINNELQKSNNANNDNLPIVKDLIQNNNINKKEVDESNNIEENNIKLKESNKIEENNNNEEENYNYNFDDNDKLEENNNKIEENNNKIEENNNKLEENNNKVEENNNKIEENNNKIEENNNKVEENNNKVEENNNKVEENNNQEKNEEKGELMEAEDINPNTKKDKESYIDEEDKFEKIDMDDLDDDDDKKYEDFDG